MSTDTLRVGFLMGQSQNNTLRKLTETIAQQFRDAGHTATSFDLLSPASIDEFEVHLRARAFDLIVAFQGWGLNFFDDGPNLFDRAQVPYVTILGDHPMYHATRLKHLSARCAVLTLDPDHVDFVREIAPCPIVGGLFGMKDTSDYGPRVPLEKRDIPLLFMGSCGDAVGARAELGRGSPALRSILLETLEVKHGGAPIRTQDALAAVLDARGIDPRSVPRLRRAALIEDVDRIARVERRLRIIRGIEQTPLTIWGTGWPDDVRAKPNVTLVQEGFPTGGAAATRAKVLLNIFHDEFAWFHDRCGIAFATGTPLLSERTQQFESVIGGFEASAYFDDTRTIDAVARRLLGAQGAMERHIAEADKWLASCPPSLAVNIILHSLKSIALTAA